jgi:hypothetical protein
MRRDAPRRVTPERMAFYKCRAKQLRDEAFVGVTRAIWGWLKRIVGRR